MLRFRPVVLMIVTLGIAAAQPASADADATHISPEQLLAQIRGGTAPSIIDVRSDGEYVAGHVPGAIHIPFYAVYARRAEIPSPPSAPVVVYCEHGPRAGIAKLQLRTAGFEDVLYLEGHMSGWKQRGLPMETGTQ
jgi:rhodanese-related sulfurtransferase